MTEADFVIGGAPAEVHAVLLDGTDQTVLAYDEDDNPWVLPMDVLPDALIEKYRAKNVVFET